MSVKMMLMSILNDVEVNKNSIENIIVSDQTQDDALSETKTLITDIQANKQDKINVLSQINCNTVSCNDLKIGSMFIKSEIANVNSSLGNLQEQISNKAETTITDYLQSAVSDMSTNYLNVQSTFSYMNTNFLNKNLSQTINGIYTFEKPPILDISSQTLSDFSIVNKKYIDENLSNTTDVLNEIYESTNKVITATTVNCTNLILNNIPFSTQPISGQVIKKTIIYKKDFTISTNTVVAGTGALLIARALYKNYLGHDLLIEFGINEYNLAGSSNDNITGLLQIVRDGVISERYRTRQNWRDGGGGGSRSGTIFPLIYFLNETRPSKSFGTEVTLNVYVGTGFSDDTFTYNNHGMGSYFIITEIAR